MPFDSFMTAALAHEFSVRLSGLKVDKICQPEKDEIDLLFHIPGRNRLIVNCTANTSFMALSSAARENPAAPPPMCMLLRKYLSRAKITFVDQPAFDRVIRITFDAGDEMGFRKPKYLYAEMMGRGSNLIFVDENGSIAASFRQNDVTTKFGRIVMVGARFTPMPLPDKLDPIRVTREEFEAAVAGLPPETPIEKAISLLFSGFGKLTAREAAYRAGGSVDASLADARDLWGAFSGIVSCVKENRYDPCLIYESEAAREAGESPIDFSFTGIRQYENDCLIVPCESASEAVETFFAARDGAERHRQHYNDIHTVLKNCRNRLEKKIAAQRRQLEDCRDSESDRLCGDLIIQEMYRVKKGDPSVLATDYSTDPPREVRVDLDERLTPAANAQKYYREYRKKETAKVKVQEQIELAERELEYCDSVLAALLHAKSQSDLSEIREELSHWNYGRRLTKGLKKPSGKPTRKAKPLEVASPSGSRIYIGMNNLQNDVVSTVLAEKDDRWFHVKKYHGSHVLLKIAPDADPSAEDLEFAASLAAFYSEVGDSDRVEVDTCRARFLKKPAGSRPGFITYKNYETLIVSPKSAK